MRQHAEYVNEEGWRNEGEHWNCNGDQWDRRSQDEVRGQCVPGRGQRESDEVLRLISSIPVWARDAKQEHVLASNNRKRDRRQRPIITTNWKHEPGKFGLQIWDWDDSEMRATLQENLDDLERSMLKTNELIAALKIKLKDATLRGVEARRWVRQQRLTRRRRGKSGSAAFGEAFQRSPVIKELKDIRKTCRKLNLKIAAGAKLVAVRDARCEWMIRCVHDDWSDTATENSSSDDNTDGGQCGQLGLH
jgi:hypothetical protein